MYFTKYVTEKVMEAVYNKNGRKQKRLASFGVEVSFFSRHFLF